MADTQTVDELRAELATVRAERDAMRAALEAYYDAWYGPNHAKLAPGAAAAAERQLRVLIGKAVQPGSAVESKPVATPQAPKKRRKRPPMPADLIERLAALGGALISTEPSAWGSYEVLTPLGDPEKRVWMTPGALVAQLDQWEAAGIQGKRIAVWMGGP